MILLIIIVLLVTAGIGIGWRWSRRRRGLHIKHYEALYDEYNSRMLEEMAQIHTGEMGGGTVTLNGREFDLTEMKLEDLKQASREYFLPVPLEGQP